MSNILIWSATSNNNLELANKLKAVVESKGESVEVVNLEAADLPLYTPPAEQKNGVPAVAKELSDQLAGAKGLIICAPEYNGGVPPVLNNAFAWVSRSGDDWRKAFSGKIGLIATHSGGPAFKYQRILRLQMEHIGMEVMTRTVATNGYTPLKDESVNKIIGKFIKFTQM